MALNRQKLAEISVSRSESAVLSARERKANREWLRMSQDIALAMHHYMREAGMTQKELAERMNVSAVYVGKLLKGGENMTLETICKIQSAMGESLISVTRPYCLYVTSIKQSSYRTSSDVISSETFFGAFMGSPNQYVSVQRAIA